jgi:hypothetical protein
MIEFFKNLREDEIEVLYRTPVLVSILIAGADDNIDKKEIKEAVNISKIKLSKSRVLLREYYQKVGENFEENLSEEIAGLPSVARRRNPVIIEELEKLNLILPKLDRQFAIQFYESMKDIAKRIATASGGILGYMAIDYQEQKLMELRMIRNPAKFKK